MSSSGFAASAQSAADRNTQTTSTDTPKAAQPSKPMTTLEMNEEIEVFFHHWEPKEC